jgi:hypothetical protein
MGRHISREVVQKVDSRVVRRVIDSFRSLHSVALLRNISVVVCPMLIVSSLSCEQYEYLSPSPGILEVRLGVANNRVNSFLPFGSNNTFIANFDDLEALQPGNVKLPIFADLSAIRRHPDGDFFNCLDPAARDSLIILGRVYAPPATFSGLRFTMSVFPFVQITYPYAVSEIIVEIPTLTQALQTVPRPGHPPVNIKVESNSLTRVTVTFDLDSSLVRKFETFEFRPYFYVSSVQTF